MGKPFNKEQGLSIEEQIIELRRQGLGYCKIARQLGISSDTVYKRAQKVSEKLQARIDAAKAELRERQIAISEYIIEESLSAWRDSREPAESTRIVEKEAVLQPKEAKEDRERQGHGGELRRNRRYPLSGIDFETEEAARQELGGDDGIAIFGDDGPPAGYYYNEETGEDTTEEEKAEIRARHLLEKSGVAGESPRLIIIERVTTETKTYRDGNPAFLSTALAASARISALAGLDAPKESALEISGDPEKPLIFEYQEIPTGEGEIQK